MKPNPNDNPISCETRRLNASIELAQAWREFERAQKRFYAAFADEDVTADGRRRGHSKLVYDKATRTLVTVDPHAAEDGPVTPAERET